MASDTDPDSTAPPARQTPLYQRHKDLGARIVNFSGWAMPVQYSSILEEHKAVRTAAGLFDVSHMGEVEFTGPGALAAVERLCSNDIRHLQDGQARYTALCYPDGGIVDDCIVYRQGHERFLIVINAGNVDKDLAWFHQHTDGLPDCQLTDISPDTALIAVQGPRALQICDRLVPEGSPADHAPSSLRSFTFSSFRLGGLVVLVARTGYTGEDGCEIFCPAAEAPALWDALLAAGKDLGVLPCGLGARDTLRLEACLSLYGNDIDATTNPYEAGLGWVVKLDHDFIGRPALEKLKAEGPSRRLAAFVMEGRGTARHGYPILSPGQAEPIGVVTSGSLGPTVGKNLGLGYVPVALAQPGTQLLIDCRGKPVPAQVVKAPFYKRATR